MMRYSRRGLLAFLTLAGSGSLGGCSRFSPSRLWRDDYALHATPVLHGSVAPVGWNLLIAMPEATSPQDQVAMLVTSDDGPPQPLESGKWRQRPPILVQEGLRDAFVQSGALQDVGLEGDGTPASFVLHSRITAFQVERQTGAPSRARIALDLTLERADTGQKLGFSSVNGEEPVMNLAPQDVVDAFNAAAGRAFREAVVWTLQTGEQPTIS